MRLAYVPSGCFLLIVMVLCIVVVTGEALARGFDGRLPGSHFKGVDEQGHVLYCDKIGDLDVGEDSPFPLHIMFKSNWMANSPYLGKGWMLPLLESRIEQTSERSYRLWQPDGLYRDFGCSKTSAAVLNGTAGWKAEIRGDTITAWEPSGWNLVFKKNKLTTIVTPKNQRLDLVSRNGQVDEVRADGVSVLRVELDLPTGRVKGLTISGGKRIAIEQQLRPRMQKIDAFMVVDGKDYSLSKVTQADGTVKTYEYAVDEQLRPTLKMGDRMIVWEPETNLIVQDGEWTYDIKPDEKNTWANAAIGRKNANGGSEFWYYDGAHGQEIVQGVDGIKKVSAWFVTGKLVGKVREIRNYSSNGDLIGRSTWSYDETGSLIRRRINDLVIEKSSGGIVVWKGNELLYTLAHTVKKE